MIPLFRCGVLSILIASGLITLLPRRQNSLSHAISIGDFQSVFECGDLNVAPDDLQRSIGGSRIERDKSVAIVVI